MKMPWQKHVEQVCGNHGMTDHDRTAPYWQPDGVAPANPLPPRPYSFWEKFWILFVLACFLILLGMGIGWVCCWIKANI